jgi:antitoxin HicB
MIRKFAARMSAAIFGLTLRCRQVTARAIKRVIARQLDALMQDQGLTKSNLAKGMRTSRAQLDRLLDPDNESVTLGALTRAAQAVGRQLRMELV